MYKKVQCLEILFILDNERKIISFSFLKPINYIFITKHKNLKTTEFNRLIGKNYNEIVDS